MPLEETIKILADKAFTNNWFNETHQLNLSRMDLVDLLRASTKDQLFQFNGQLYEQIDGVAMGSPLGPLLANVFMGSIEDTLEREGKMPSFYKRYVDDTLTIMPDTTSAATFLQVLNSSACWSYFSEECDRLRAIFSRLKYPQHLIDTTIKIFVTSKAEDQQPIRAPVDSPTVRIVLPFKDQVSADFVRKQLKDLSQKTHTAIQPVLVSNKIEQKLKCRRKNRLL